MLLSVMTITESFNGIVAKQKEIGYYFPQILNRPATIEQIEEAESAFGFKLNDELRELYGFADGSIVDGIDSGKAGLMPIQVFLRLGDAVVEYLQGIEIRESFTNFETGYTPGKKLFPFLSDGGGNLYWVDLNEGENYGRIYWTNTFGEDPTYHFSSLSNMFNLIHECYAKGIYFLDEDGYLDCDWEGFRKIAAQHEPEIVYWKVYN